MIVVVLIATIMTLARVVYGAKRRRDAYLARAKYHARCEAQIRSISAKVPDFVTRQLVEDGNEPFVEYHAKLARKYKEAASRPWLPIEPDPPKPK
jgi:hypothetical protein